VKSRSRREGMEIKYNMRKAPGAVLLDRNATLFLNHGDGREARGKDGTDYYESYELNDKKVKQNHTGPSSPEDRHITGGSGRTKATSR